MARLGIGVLAFDRCDYLRATLDGLKSNDLTDCDVWLFQDGAKNRVTGKAWASQADLDEVFRAFRESGFELAVRHEHNIGIAHNRLSLFEQFDSRYDGWIQLEDDVVMSRNCVGVMRHLLEQFRDMKDIGMIMSPLVDGIAGQDPLCLFRGVSHVGCFATRREWFGPVLARFREYCAAIGDREYQNHDAYRRDVHALMGTTDILCSSDGALQWALKASGLSGWVLGMSRSRCVGVKGLHMRQAIYDKYRFGDVVLRDYQGETEQPWRRDEHTPFRRF